MSIVNTQLKGLRSPYTVESCTETVITDIRAFMQPYVCFRFEFKLKQ